MSEVEAQFMQAMLRQDFDGADELRRQLEHCRVESSCGCGCGSLHFFVGDDEVDVALGRELAPIEAALTDQNGDCVGASSCFSSAVLFDLDVFSFDEPRQVPDLAEVRWLLRT